MYIIITSEEKDWGQLLLVKNINQLMTLNYKTLGQLILQIIVK